MDEKTMVQRAELVSKVIERVGLPTVICVFFLFAAWRGSTWIADGLVLPMVQAHLKTLEEVQASTASQALALQAMAENLHQETNGAKGRADLLGQILAEQRKTTTAIELLAKRMEK